MMYPVAIEQTATGYSAYSLDLPDCIATGGTLDEVKATTGEAMEFHLEGIAEAG